MDISSVPPITQIDLINFIKDLAQVNVNYLAISVAILVVLGGVFVYFNLNPLKDGLSKQEKDINDLKEGVKNLISDSVQESKETLQDFKKNQDIELFKILKQENEKIFSEIENKVVNLENNLLEKIIGISEDKDIKVKEILLSEVKANTATLEKLFDSSLSKQKDFFIGENAKINRSIEDLKSDMKDVKRDIKEFKVYKYGQEGKMGSIIYSIELLKEDIDEKSWRIPDRLENLKNQIKGIPLDPDYITRIEEQLSRIESERKYNILIQDVKNEYVKKEKS